MLPAFVRKLIAAGVCVAGLLHAGCLPLVPEDKFLAAASSVALDPTATCEELKLDFGLPDVTTVADPAGINLSFVEEFITTSDGQTLRAWLVPAQVEERGVVLLSYGAVGEMACYLLITRELTERGWSVAMYDYRGFGGSTGEASLTGLLPDATAALDWALQRSGRERIALMGVSIGTIPTVALDASRGNQVLGIVLDGPISLEIELQRFILLLTAPIDRLLEQFDPRLLLEQTLRAASRPILVFLYGQDEFLTGAVAGDLLAESPAAVEVYEFPDLAHARGPYFATEEYFDALVRFLDRVAAR
ncbi:Alpha/beta hydrolase family protein [Phycisphaerae bacterium RAS1]|nr:Alpha/beta hydrolase family protein [Phycisphaerae bacterium RAS1]